MHYNASLLWISATLFLLAVSFVVLYIAASRSHTTPVQSSANKREQLIQLSQKWWGKSKMKNENRLAEIVTLMRQGGYTNSRQQILCIFRIAVIWSTLILALSSNLIISIENLLDIIIYLLLYFILGSILTLQWLKSNARQRAKIIDEEMLITVHLMAILWQVGLSLESLLRTYHQEASKLTPEINKEIAIILARIGAGQSRETALSDVAAISLSVGLQDLLTMLSQYSSTGGELQNSFQALAHTLQERKRTDLQEKVSKMSGKISFTMMAFLFPALFIVLAGPATLALISALRG
ncbi:type II secretion system protein [Vibrio natriegens]|uniref:type II secretion system F family protein n=1 Tax=Vibrio natriegens TaxID=691 RepID=UPI000803D784|nr:type II secretion system F family protein [Vibrio natriegens]ANQ28636.1 type II secretion system protein [Vibrio natriegens]